MHGFILRAPRNIAFHAPHSSTARRADLPAQVHALVASHGARGPDSHAHTDGAGIRGGLSEKLQHAEEVMVTGMSKGESAVSLSTEHGTYSLVALLNRKDDST